VAFDSIKQRNVVFYLALSYTTCLLRHYVLTLYIRLQINNAFAFLQLIIIIIYCYNNLLLPVARDASDAVDLSR